MTDSTPPFQSDQNLPVPIQQTTAIGRPAGGSGRVPPSQNWQTGEPESVPWGQYLDALRRRWWVIVIVAVGGSALGRYVSEQVAPEYTASTKVFIGSSGAGGARDIGGPIVAPSTLTLNTLRDMVKTPPVVAPVVRSLALNVHFKRADSTLFRGFGYDSAFTPGSYRLTIDTTGAGYVLTHSPRSDSPRREQGALGDSVGRSFGLRWQPTQSQFKPKQVVDFAVSDVLIEATGLGGKIVSGVDEEGGQILTLTLTTTDRGLVAPTLNELAKEFVAYVGETKRISLTERRRIIEDQLRQATAQRDVAQSAWLKFREANVFAPTEISLPPGSIAAQKVQLDQVRSDRERIRLARLSATGTKRIEDYRLNVPSIMNASTKLQDALRQLTIAEQELKTARQDYADGSPDVTKRLAQFMAVNDTIIPGILGEIDSNLEATEKALVAEVSARSDELSQIPKRAIEGATLQRAADQAVLFWTSVNTIAQQARLVDEQTTADLTVISEAITPQLPSSSRGPRLFLLAVVASIGAGLAIALLLDRLDRRFRYPQQATMELGLTIAGTIPFFKPNRKGELNLAASAQVVESFRTLRLATQFHFPPGEPVVVCITSPGPGEGKSLVASNLAVAFANAGQKTLLIDGDVRRGVVHTTFETERRPGLVDYLGGTATSMQIVRPTSTEHLFIMPSGSRSRRAPELLTSERMAGLIVEMRSQYDVIIVDSAPFVAGMDAFALGAAAGTMLVVLRPGVTDRKLAENKLEILDRLPVTIIGAVLNAISGGRAYRYYSDYTTYEGEEDQDEADFDGPAPPTSPTRLISRR